MSRRRGSASFLALGGALAAAFAYGAAAPPVVTRGPYLQLGTPTSIVVRWATSKKATSRVAYGTRASLLDATQDHSDPVREHVVELNGLVPGTTYFYAVGSIDGTPSAGDPSQRFVTAPVPSPPAPHGVIPSTRVWVIGDSGHSNSGVRAVRDAYARFTGARGTDEWLLLGDNAYDSGTRSEYEQALFGNVFRDMLKTTVVWPALGNHDAESSDASGQDGPFFQLFTLPGQGEAGGEPSGTEAYYSFDRANVHFVCLDSSGSSTSPTGKMAKWLVKDLQATGRQWIVAYWHHAPYSRGKHDSDDDPDMAAMREDLLPILEAHGVDLVLGGHSHDYERSMLLDGHYGESGTLSGSMIMDAGDGRVDGDGAYAKPSLLPAAHEGTVYVVNGAASDPEGGSLDHPAMVRSLARLGSVVLDIHGNQLDLRFIDAHGAVRDAFTIVKGAEDPLVLDHAAVARESAWRFLDQGVEPDPAWRDLGFDDGAWGEAPGVLGYGKGIVDSEVSFGPDPDDKFITTWFRRAFDLPHSSAAIESLRLYVRYDDGFAAYLNGAEVARRSLPEGTLAATTLAEPHAAKHYELIDLSGAVALLRPGANLLAFEVHQAGPKSKDLVFDAEVRYDAFVVP